MPERRPPLKLGVPAALLLAAVSGAAAVAVAQAVFRMRGMFDRWDCGASDCDTVSLGGAYLALLAGVVGLVAGPAVVAWRARTLGEIGLRLGLWCVVVGLLAWGITLVWDFPEGHPAA